MGVDFAIEFEPRQPSLSGVTEEQIAEYYRANVPSGDPPLSAIWFDADLENLAKELGVTPLQRFQREPGPEPVSAGEYVFDSHEEEQAWLEARAAERQRHAIARGPGWNAWCEPADGLRTVRALHAALAPSAQDQRACLALLEEMLAIAEREQRRWRVLAFW